MPRKTKELSEEKETKKTTSNINKVESKIKSKKEISTKKSLSDTKPKKGTKTSVITTKKN